MTTPSSEARRLGWLVTALVAAPLLSPGWLPFSDLAEHAAAMGTLARYGDPSFRFAEHYTVAWSTSQYMLAHLVGAAIVKTGASAAGAVKVLLVGLVGAWVHSLRWLLRVFGVDERLALLGALLFWNRALALGFLPYVASLPALFATYALFVQGLERPRPVALAGAAVLVFYTHASAFTLLGALVAVHVAWRGWEEARREPLGGVLRRAGRRLVWLAPAGLLAGIWVARGRFAMQKASIHSSEEIGTMEPWRAIKVAPLWSHDMWVSHVDEGIGLAFWILFLVLLFPVRRDEARQERFVPFVVVLAVYLSTPFRVGTGFLLNVRMAPVLAVFALLVLRPRSERRARLAAYAAVALAAVQCVDNVRHIRELQRDVAGVPELLATMPRGAKLIGLNFSGMDASRAHVPPWLYAGSYHRAENGGVASFSFSELSHWSVQYRPETAPPKQDALAWATNPCLYRNARDGAYFDFVLVRGAVDPFRARPRGPTWKVRGRTAKYTLWEKDASVVAEGGDDGPCEGLARPSATARP